MEIVKLAPMMSDKELRRRKNISAGVGVTTAVLGLTALGSKGAGAVLRKVGRVKRSAPTLKYGRHADAAANTLAVIGAGIGGAGGFNAATIQRQEARRRRAVLVPRSEASKAWTDDDRNKASTGLKIGSGLSFGAAGVAGLKYAEHTGRIAQHKIRLADAHSEHAAIQKPRNRKRYRYRVNEIHNSQKALSTARFRQARAGKVGAALATIGVGTAVGSQLIKPQPKKVVIKPKKLVVHQTVVKAFDPEALRHQRAKDRDIGMKVGSGLTLGAAGVTGAKLGHTELKLHRQKSFKATLTRPAAKGQATRLINATRKSRNKYAIAAGALAGLGTAGLVANDRINSYQARHGATYRPRYKKPN